MKKKYLIIFCLFFSFYTQAQIQITNPATFNTAGQGDLYIDNDSIYYIGLQDGSLKEIGILTEKGSNNGDILTWDATNKKWISGPAAAAGNAWHLSGNDITNGDFIGTKNDQDLLIKVNDKESGKISVYQNSVGLGYETTAAFKSVAIGRAISNTGTEAVSIGFESQSAFQSIAIGAESTNSGTESVAIGRNSNAQFKSVVLGASASTSNTESIAIGHSAAAAFQGIAIGVGAISSANNAIAIGTNVSVAQANALILGNNHDVGIGTNTPSNRLEINSGATNQSGLTLSQLNSSVVSKAEPIGVDSDGRVVKATKATLQENGNGTATFDNGFDTPVTVNTGQTAYVGQFIITATGTQTITGLPFQPSSITFVAHANVETLNLDSDNGVGNNNNSIANSFGTMNGFARDNGGSITQQVIYVGGSGASINDISRYASSANAIGVRYSNQNGDNLGRTLARVTSFNTNGFTLNVTSKADNIVVLFTAYR